MSIIELKTAAPKLVLRDLKEPTPYQPRSRKEWLQGALRLANIGVMRANGLSKGELCALADAIQKGM